MKPGAASFPMFGVKPAVVDPTSACCSRERPSSVLCFSQPGPGIARSIWGAIDASDTAASPHTRAAHGSHLRSSLDPPGDHERYLPRTCRARGCTTGDGCRRDKDGYIWITGRVDDVLNVSGYRLGTAEIESALVAHLSCVEAAVIDPARHQGAGRLRVRHPQGGRESKELIPALKQSVRNEIGGLAIPEFIVHAGLLKTRQQDHAPRAAQGGVPRVRPARRLDARRPSSRC